MDIKFRLFRHKYCLRITSTYCGTIATNLKPLEGENWLRGDDLKDGKLWKLPLVLWDIVCYEFSIDKRYI